MKKIVLILVLLTIVNFCKSQKMNPIIRFGGGVYATQDKEIFPTYQLNFFEWYNEGKKIHFVLCLEAAPTIFTTFTFDAVYYPFGFKASRFQMYLGGKFGMLVYQVPNDIKMPLFITPKVGLDLFITKKFAIGISSFPVLYPRQFQGLVANVNLSFYANQ